MKILKVIFEHPIMVGLLILMMNLCSKYIIMDIPEYIQDLMSHIWIRRLSVFAIIFITTKNIEIALLITLLFVIIFQYLLNDRKKICLFKGDDTKISMKEYIESKKIVDRYEKQNKK